MRDFVNNFVPHIPSEKQVEQEAVEETIEILKNKCRLVGFTNRLDDFASAMNKEFGFRPSFEVHNANPASKEEQDKVVTSELVKSIDQLCRPNQLVYDSLRYCSTFR